MVSADATLPGVLEQDPRRVWFGHSGCVERQRDGVYHVLVGGTLIGMFDDEDAASRDVLIAMVARTGDVGQEDIARAFRVSRSTVVRVLARLHRGGVANVAKVREVKPRKLTPELQRRLCKLFDKGLGVRQAHRVVAKRLSYGRVQWVHKQWEAQRIEAAVPERNAVQQSLDLETTPSNDTAPESSEGSAAGPELPLEGVLSESGRLVQHAGTWMMLGMLAAMGLYEIAEQSNGNAVHGRSLRVALDAVAVALSLGEGCVEGIRRVQTPTLPVLLRNGGGITANWARRVIGEFAEHAHEDFHFGVAERLLRDAIHDDHRVFLYIDNHMRPYTGKHEIRKGWRMQSKRAVHGVTDYYVHDEEGCPLWRMSTASHDSLCAWLRPAVDFVEEALGKEAVPVLMFDRGGAFPESMAELRDLGAEFITYERAPYAMLSPTEFTEELRISLESRPLQPIVVRYTETRDKNLGSGRGRVRRVALKMPDGNQINLLAASTLPAETLIRKQLARWGYQENQFKHEVERWGLNNLDRRKVEPYPPDAIIPNPARRRLERELKLAEAAEGRALRLLARLDADDPKRARLEQERRAAVKRQEEILELRPLVPVRARVDETPLAGKLQRHRPESKTVLDTLRIALANAEAELASHLRPHMDRPREAKKLLANIFAAPARITLRKTTISVRLEPAASRSERAAIASFLRTVNRLRLALPGDLDARPLRFGMLK